MKTNTNLAMITIDCAYAEQALAQLITSQKQVGHLLDWSADLSFDGHLLSAYWRSEDAIRHLENGISEMKRIIRKNKRAAIRKSGGGARATNRTITGIG